MKILTTVGEFFAGCFSSSVLTEVPKSIKSFADARF
jgi:hypothetical protein